MARAVGPTAVGHSGDSPRRVAARPTLRHSNPNRIGVSRSSGRPCCWGETADGRRLFCVYEYLGEITIIPVTACEVPD
jgi:hypothetical protein